MQALIIVPEPDLHAQLAATLRDLGLEPVTVATLSVAAELFSPEQHRLIVVTWRAPDWDATEFCQNLRKADPDRLSTILVLTTNDRRSSDFQLAFDAGADDFMVYPIEPALLRIRLQIAVRRIQSRADSIRIEQQLRESNERFDLAVRGANEGLWDARPGNPWYRPDAEVWFSPRFKELLGFSDDEFPNLMGTWAARLHPDDRQRVFQAVTEHFDLKKPYDVQYRLLTKAGEYRWFSACGQALWDEQNQLVRMCGALRDITQVKNYEAMLLQSEANWRSLVENAPDIILLSDFNGTIKFINRYTDIAKDSIGRSIYDYVEEPYRERMRAR